MGKILLIILCVLLLPVSWSFYGVILAIKRTWGWAAFVTVMVLYVAMIAFIVHAISSGYLGLFSSIVILLCLHAGATWHFRADLAQELKFLKRNQSAK